MIRRSPLALSSRMRPLRASVGFALAAALLAGCAGLPTGGEVQTARIPVDDDGGDLITIAEGPQAGATPEELLAGFLRAQRAPQGDYGVAREFLTDSFRSDWSPTAWVRVTDSPLIAESMGSTRLSIDVEVAAVVNSRGNYTQLVEPEAESLVYTFSRNDADEWRISSAPDGIVLSRNRFSATFSNYPLYFFDPSGRYLVPDMRWFPQTASRAERIVAELLRGQSPWYQGGVLVSAFPDGTHLGSERVEIASGRASVDLTSEVAAQPLDARWRMQQQLVASLVGRLSDVSSVQLTSGGFPIQIGSGEVPEATQRVSDNPHGFVDDRFGALTSDGVERVPQLSAKIESLGPLGVTIGRTRTTAAVRNAGGVWLVRRAEDEPKLIDARPGLVDPTLDGQGYVWSVPARHPESILAIAADGTSQPMAAPYLDGRVVALDVSRDGARTLVATRGAAGGSVVVAGIVRDSSGVPAGLGEPLRFSVGAGKLLDAAWVDATTIATLNDTGSARVVQLFRIGGQHELLGDVEGAVQLVGGNGVDGLRAVDDEGRVWRRSGSGGWQGTGMIVSFLATQQ